MLKRGFRMATSMDLFAYLAAFVSVVLALAVSDWVQSFHRLIRARARVRWSLTAIIAALVVFMAILEEFFGLWRLGGIERFTYLDLLVLIGPPILLSMAAMTVLPDAVPEQGIDLAQHYMDNRRVLYLLLALWVFGIFLRLTDLEAVATGRVASLLELASMFPWQTLPLLAVLGLMAWSTDRRVQLAGVIVAFLLVNGAMVNRVVELPASPAVMPR
jgi:hypothetical protein